MDKFFKSLNFLPRWIILLIDLSFLGAGLGLAYLLRFNFDMNDILRFNPVNALAFYLVGHLIAILFTQSYAGIIRYTGLQDGLRIAYTTFIGALIVFLFDYGYNFFTHKFIIPISVQIIALFSSVLFLFSYRVAVKHIFSFYGEAVKKTGRVLIYGVDQSALLAKQIIDMDTTGQMKVVGFIAEDDKKVGKIINGVPIFSAQEGLDEILQQMRVKELIISAQSLTFNRKNEIVDVCLRNDVKVRTVPHPERWIKGELSIKQIKELNIEDLLGRPAIQLDNPKVLEELFGKVVMITGAGGSIGSELSKQIALLAPKQIVIIDQAESALYEIEQELIYSLKTATKIDAVVLDITKYVPLKAVFDKYKPDIIYHAAAYKHVPLMEKYPKEAVMNNTIATRQLADLAVAYDVNKFVMISTDKAVNPTNVMGASKRMAELYVQALNKQLERIAKSHTKFVTTRFGNVLGSNGSVIPLFKKQIAKGGPVTVTHPDVTRYFMTIPEACQLVLEAGAMGEGGEIFIFDMGKSMKIADLAEKMIRLSGFVANRDIKIEFTGLREGEKLYEELLNEKENTIPTHHTKIMIAKTREKHFDEINEEIDLLIKQIDSMDDMTTVQRMKRIVPEFISNSSRFEVLDKRA